MGAMRQYRFAFLLAAVAIMLPIGFYLLRAENRYPDPQTEAAAAPYRNTFFDPDPQHPWNQLYGLLFIRPAWNGQTYGLNVLDPLYWPSTKHLLEPPLHAKAIAQLDQFVQSDAAHRIKDPVKRALLQRMLWALFDNWSSHHDFYDGEDQRDFAAERRALQIRLIRIMKAIALTDDQIAALPDNYAREVASSKYASAYDPARPGDPFLPATFYTGGDWVNLRTDRYEQLAPVHVEALSGRSGFDVLLSLPGGHDATLAYLRELNSYQPKWVYDGNKASHFVNVGNAPPYLSADLPQVPLLTKFALVRRANLIDTDGKIAQSPITESIQIRVIRSELPDNSSGGEQTFLMFELDCSALMKGEGGLVALGPNQMTFNGVFKGEDLLARRDRFGTDSHGESAQTQSCFGCHNRAGIFSMNSYIQFFQSERTVEPPVLADGGSSWYSMRWKEQQYDWGLLQAYWFAQ